MHITDAALSNEVMITTNALAVVGVGVGLAKIDYEKVPRVGVLAAVFFVASLIGVRTGVTSVHLLLNGLLGLLLSWAVFPALAAALFLQAIMLGFGGITSLGANIINTAIPGLLCCAIFSGLINRASSRKQAVMWGVCAGSLGVALTAVMVAVSLHLSDTEAFDAAIKAVFLGHIPVLVIEAVVVGATVGFLRDVRPELLESPLNKKKSRRNHES